MSLVPEKTVLVSPQHELKIEAVKFPQGQTFQINRFQTSFENILSDAYQNLNDWTQKGNTFTPASASPAPLTWTGWPGSQSRLYLSGSPGVVVKILWDDQPTTIDFSQTGGHAVIQHEFSTPIWELAVLAAILWGTLLYLACLVLVNSRALAAAGFLPAWGGYTVLAGFLFLILALIPNLPLGDLELLLIISLAAICILPSVFILRELPQTRLGRLIMAWTGSTLNKYSTALLVVFSLLLAIGIFGRSVWANWNVIDDHELISFMGPAGKLTLSQVFPSMQQTEIGSWGFSNGRFRPTYYFLRLLECVLWGAHPFYWHLARIAILAVGIGIFWLLMRPSLGWLGSGLLCAYALTFPYLTEVIGRLGPGETYAIAGLPIFVWGMARGLSVKEMSLRRQILPGAGILVGGVICIGSKENFVLLAIPAIYLAYQCLKRKQLVLSIASLGTILFALFVGIVVILAVLHRGTDQYFNPVSPQTRMAALLAALLEDPQDLAAIGALAGFTLLLSLIHLKRDADGQMARWVRSAQFWLIVLGLIYLSQLFFYNGVWPTGNRYDFPGLLYLPAAIYVLFTLGRKIELTEEQGSQAAILRTSLILALTAVIVVKGYQPILQSLDDNVRETGRFNLEIQTISATLKSHADYALVIESGRPIDYEPIFSYVTFLQAYGADNKLFLRIHRYSPESAAPGLEKRLAASLWMVSNQGNGTFLPLEQLSTFGSHCYSLNLSGTFPTECTPLP